MGSAGWGRSLTWPSARRTPRAGVIAIGIPSRWRGGTIALMKCDRRGGPAPAIASAGQALAHHRRRGPRARDESTRRRSQHQPRKRSPRPRIWRARPLRIAPRSDSRGSDHDGRRSRVGSAYAPQRLARLRETAEFALSQSARTTPQGPGGASASGEMWGSSGCLAAPAASFR